MSDNPSSCPAVMNAQKPSGANAANPSILSGVRRLRYLITVLSLAVMAAAFCFFSERGLFQGRADADHRVAPPADAPQTITEILTGHGLSREMAEKIVDAARPVYDLGRIRAGRTYSICFAEGSRFRDLRYAVDDERYLTVYHDVAGGRLVPVIKNFPFETRVESVSAEVESSLYESVLGVGEKDQLAILLADIFGSDIDFHTDIQKGDSFRVLIQKKFLDGRFAKYGDILAASFTNQQREIVGFRFEDENGKPAYYGPDGKALKKSFLKSPLKYAPLRVASRFSYARYHPILKVVRPHLGVDYAAPAGSPVQAVAAGVVRKAGREGASGNMIRIRHASGYDTAYLHLSSIRVKSGARVSQGDIIGYVGSSGLSTGPHLDFRVWRYGKPVNPAKMVFPPGRPVPPEMFSRFSAVRDSLMAQLKPE
mgnify:CR=1 FL=1